jgi:SAM-dependent methyltransferase
MSQTAQTGQPEAARLPATHLAPCDLCGGTQFREGISGTDLRVGLPTLFQIYECKRCGLACLQPQPPQTVMENHYRDFLWQEETQRGRLAQRLSLALRVLNKLRPEGGRLLDVGCATGNFVLAAEKAGWQALGLEVSAAQVQAGVQRGAKVALCRDFLRYEPESAYDAVTFNHVLEHVPAPSAYLRRAFQILKPGGIALISVPNYASLSRRVFGPYWTHLDLPRHWFHFSEHTLRLLLESAGFRVVNVTFECREDNALGIRDSLRRIVEYRLGSKPLVSRKAARAPEDESHRAGMRAAVTFLYRGFGDLSASATERLHLADTLMITAATPGAPS